MQALDPRTPERAKRVLFLCGSPRKAGNTEALLTVAQEAAEQDHDVIVETFYLSDKEISPCVSCGGCLETGECVIRDHMDEFLSKADEADVLIVGTPVFWAGPPAQLKALYDRLQPRWARRYVLGEEAAPKRSAYLLVTGTGNDPHGYEPLITISRSALAVLGFLLMEVCDCVGFDLGMSEGDRAGFEEKAHDLGLKAAALES